MNIHLICHVAVFRLCDESNAAGDAHQNLHGRTQSGPRGCRNCHDRNTRNHVIIGTGIAQTGAETYFVYNMCHSHALTLGAQFNILCLIVSYLVVPFKYCNLSEADVVSEY